jgi:hypothetical protein
MSQCRAPENICRAANNLSAESPHISPTVQVVGIIDFRLRAAN